MKPLKIGLSPCFFHADPQRPIFKGKTLTYLEQSLAQWVMSEGVLTYMIPFVEGGKSPVSIKDLVSELDGLVLQGGSDVSPQSYGEKPMKPEWNGDAIRDCYEMGLVREFMAQGKPVLGICRGAQLINVCFGGTLYQDIQTQLPQAKVHRDWQVYDQLFHDVVFEPGCGLAKLYPGIKKAKVNTVHHQGLKDIGKDLVVEARSEPDGIVEAVRLKGDSYVFAVQWHPEFHGDNSTLMDGKPFLKEFLDEARKRKRG